MLKICVNPTTGAVLDSSYSHADAIGAKNYKEYDHFTRAIYWEDKRVIYFRFACKNWDNPTEEDKQEAYTSAEKSLDILQEKGIIPKRVKALFWETGHGITERDIRL
jgi:hypothetical protein